MCLEEKVKVEKKMEGIIKQRLVETRVKVKYFGVVLYEDRSVFVSNRIVARKPLKIVIDDNCDDGSL